MAAENRMPDRRGFVLAGIVGVAEFLVLLVRGHPWWALLAAPVAAGIVLTVIAGIARPPRRSPPDKPPAHTQPDDFRALLDQVTSVSNNIQDWQESDLETESRAQAERAVRAMDGIIDIIDDVMGEALGNSVLLKRITASVQMVESDAHRRPGRATEWFRLADRLERRRQKLQEAIDEMAGTGH